MKLESSRGNSFLAPFSEAALNPPSSSSVVSSLFFFFLLRGNVQNHFFLGDFSVFASFFFLSLSFSFLLDFSFLSRTFSGVLGLEAAGR